MRAPGLTTSRFQCLAASTTGVIINLRPGTTYELRCSSDVLVRVAGGPPVAGDLRVRPDSPLFFEADVASLVFAPATGVDVNVWLREVKK